METTTQRLEAIKDTEARMLMTAQAAMQNNKGGRNYERDRTSIQISKQPIIVETNFKAKVEKERELYDKIKQHTRIQENPVVLRDDLLASRPSELESVASRFTNSTFAYSLALAGIFFLIGSKFPVMLKAFNPVTI